MVFSYKSGRFARSLAVHRTRPALNSQVSVDNTQSNTYSADLLIFTDQHQFSLSCSTSKGAKIDHVML